MILNAALALHGTPGASYAIVRYGRIAGIGGAGTRSCNGGAAPDGSTRFAIGSLTKQFVAVAAMHAVEQGRIRLDERVTDVLPEDTALAGVTIAELLQQRSGIGDYNQPAFLRSHVGVALRPSHDAIAAALGSVAPAFAPGSRFEYSNANYYIAGAVLERVYATSLERVIDSTIIAPLQLHDTYFGTPGGPNAASACGVMPWGVANIPQFPPELTWAAGGMTSSAHDMAVFESALLDGRLIDARSVAFLFTPGGGAVTPAGDYAASWFVYSAGSTTAAWHDGTVLGYKAAVVAIPQCRNAVVILSNADYFHAAPAAFELANREFGLAGGEPERGIDPNQPRAAYPIALVAALAGLLAGVVFGSRVTAAVGAAVAYAGVAIVWWAPIALACAVTLALALRRFIKGQARRRRA